MSYSYNGNCYADVKSLSAAVVKTFPQWSGDGFTSLNSISASDAGNVSLVLLSPAGQAKEHSFIASSDCVPFSSVGLIGAIAFSYFVGWGAKRILGVIGFVTDAGKLD